MFLRVLLAFLGGFVVAAGGLLVWYNSRAPGKLPPLEIILPASLGAGLVLALLYWLKVRDKTAKMPGQGWLAKRKAVAAAAAEPAIEDFQRKRGPVGLAAAVADGEAARLEEPVAEAEDADGTPDIPIEGPVMVLRRPRHSGTDWEGARSWFGGQPRLGPIAWPVGVNSGKPLPFGAQIDLAELARVRPDNPLPKAGWLAFFLDEGAVVYVPALAGGGRNPITPVPEGAEPAYEPQHDIFPQNPSPYARSSFPYWPVELMLTAEAHWEVEDGGQSLGDFPQCDMLWWRSVHLFIEQLRRNEFKAAGARRVRAASLTQAEALRAELLANPEAEADAVVKVEQQCEREQRKLETLDRQIAAIPAVIGLLEDFCQGMAEWQPLSPRDREDFLNTQAAIRQQFPDLTSYGTVGDERTLPVITAHEMFTGSSEAFAALPPEVIDVINTAMRKPVEHNHQVFGEVVDIHGGAADLQRQHVLLLQMVADEMIRLDINSGVYSFWLDPDSIAAKDWAAAKTIVEC